MSSGEHPMADPPSGDDACHVMKPATRYTEQQDAWDRVATGRFGAHMQVALINDGPVTFWLEAAQE